MKEMTYLAASSSTAGKDGIGYAFGDATENFRDVNSALLHFCFHWSSLSNSPNCCLDRSVFPGQAAVRFAACQTPARSRPFSLYSIALCLATVSVHADILYLPSNTKIDLLGAPLLLRIARLPIEFLVSRTQL